MMMQDKPMFWTVFKADLLFTICSVTVSILITLAIAWWRKKKNAKNAILGPKKIDGPQMLIFGGEKPKPQHCPLCGRHWLLPGPLPPPSPFTPPSEQVKHDEPT